MKINRIVLISLVFIIFCCNFAMVNGQQDDGDDITFLPSQYVEPGSATDITTVLMDIKWDTPGEGVYFDIQFNTTVSGVMIVNSTVKREIQLGSIAITQEIAVNDIVRIETTEFVGQLVIPYDDTFTFFIFHSKPLWGWLDGWYAKDLTTPECEVVGLEEGATVVYGTTIELQIHYEPDRFNITELQVNKGYYPVRVETINTDGPIDWNVSIATDSMSRGDNFISLIIRDGVGNEGQKTINFVIPFPIEPPDPPDPAVMYMTIGGVISLGVVIGLVSYRNTRIEEGPKKTSRPYRTESKDGTPYKKKHRDKKGYKKST